MRKTIVFAVAAAFTLAGCGTSGEVSDEATGNTRPSESASVEETPPAEEAAPAEETPAAPVNPKFGETYTFEDGVAVTVSSPQPFQPSEFAYVGEPPPTAFVAFDVTVVNGSQANYEPSLFTASMQSTNVEQEQVFDSEQGVEGSPTTPILPGREARFRIVFGATDPADLVMQVSPGFEYEPVIYTL